MVRDFFSDLLKVSVLGNGEAYIPYTITYIFRKRKQYLDLMSLPEDKRPTEYLFWVAPADELEEWVDKVINSKQPTGTTILIDESEIM